MRPAGCCASWTGPMLGPGARWAFLKQRPGGIKEESRMGSLSHVWCWEALEESRMFDSFWFMFDVGICFPTWDWMRKWCWLFFINWVGMLVCPEYVSRNICYGWVNDFVYVPSVPTCFQLPLSWIGWVDDVVHVPRFTIFPLVNPPKMDGIYMNLP